MLDLMMTVFRLIKNYAESSAISAIYFSRQANDVIINSGIGVKSHAEGDNSANSSRFIGKGITTHRLVAHKQVLASRKRNVVVIE